MGVFAFFDWYAALEVAVMGTAVAAAVFLLVGVFASSYTELTD